MCTNCHILPSQQKIQNHWTLDMLSNCVATESLHIKNLYYYSELSNTVFGIITTHIRNLLLCIPFQFSSLLFPVFVYHIGISTIGFGLFLQLFFDLFCDIFFYIQVAGFIFTKIILILTHSTTVNYIMCKWQICKVK